MELNKEKLETTANRFLMIGIMGIISTIITVITIIFMLFSLLFSIIPNPEAVITWTIRQTIPPFLEALFSILPALMILLSIAAVITIITQSLQYHLLGYGLEELGLITKTNMKNYRKAKRFYIFNPIGTGLTTFLAFGSILQGFLMIENPMVIYPFMVFFLIFDFISLAIMILGLIGTIYYGIFVYKIGKNLVQNLLVAGGILLIVYPFVGAILVSMGIKRIIKYNVQ